MAEILKIEGEILLECLDKEVTNIVIPEGVKKNQRLGV